MHRSEHETLISIIYLVRAEERTHFCRCPDVLPCVPNQSEEEKHSCVFCARTVPSSEKMVRWITKRFPS